MRPFAYSKARGADSAVAGAQRERVRFIAGGTTLVDLMRLDVERPEALVDITGLALADIEQHDGGLRIGALARNSDVAAHHLVRERYPALAEALLAGASPQLRNMATVGGNLLQRTRCPYFRDVTEPACNKREPGSGCAAQEGYNRSHAILGGSPRCIATNPSDMCVALVALDAVVHTLGARGPRAIPVGDFHLVPAERPEVETVLERGELITHVTLPASPFAARSTYLKVRDRASFDFALASAAVALEVEAGVVRDARVALGGVATKPWRSAAAEKALVGQAPSTERFRAAAAVAVRGAEPKAFNAFKVRLAERVVIRALERAGALA